MTESQSAPTAFRQRLQSLINEYSLENGSDTPDFILAEYLDDCLQVFNNTLQAREKWHGREIGHKEYKVLDS